MGMTNDQDLSATPTYSPHQLAYFAHQLTRRAAADSMDRMAGALLDAQVDLNPHQIDAALFATSNPLSKGSILADEVGLGKTIEAGLLIAQRWAERKRRILVITPANLRKQWHQELADKFGITAAVLEAKSFKQAIKDGASNPFDAPSVLITSYQFASGKAKEVQSVPWDLVVIDEAHRLRNVYKPDNKTARTLKDALISAPKVLLTATPLQNSLLELYGLVSFVDEKVFGDLDSFRSQFGSLKDAASFDALKRRIAPVCKRTLRRQVEAYVKYTKRIPLLQEFVPGADETDLYNLVSEYLQRDSLFALPNSQRQLITLVLRKLLASSTFAIAGALESLAKRLRQTLDEKCASLDLAEELDQDFEGLDELADEIDHAAAGGMQYEGWLGFAQVRREASWADAEAEALENEHEARAAAMRRRIEAFRPGAAARSAAWQRTAPRAWRSAAGDGERLPLLAGLMLAGEAGVPEALGQQWLLRNPLRQDTLARLVQHMPAPADYIDTLDEMLPQAAADEMLAELWQDADAAFTANEQPTLMQACVWLLLRVYAGAKNAEGQGGGVQGDATEIAAFTAEVLAAPLQTASVRLSQQCWQNIQTALNDAAALPEPERRCILADCIQIAEASPDLLRAQTWLYTLRVAWDLPSEAV